MSLDPSKWEEELPTHLKDDYLAWYNRGLVLEKLGRYEEAIASLYQAWQLKSDEHCAWEKLDDILRDLERYEEAIASFDEAVKIRSDDPDTFYNKACCYALQDNIEQAIENLQKAINLSPEKYREMAKTDSDFDRIQGL